MNTMEDKQKKKKLLMKLIKDMASIASATKELSSDDCKNEKIPIEDLQEKEMPKPKMTMEIFQLRKKPQPQPQKKPSKKKGKK